MDVNAGLPPRKSATKGPGAEMCNVRPQHPQHITGGGLGDLGLVVTF